MPWIKIDDSRSKWVSDVALHRAQKRRRRISSDVLSPGAQHGYRMQLGEDVSTMSEVRESMARKGLRFLEKGDAQDRSLREMRAGRYRDA